MNVDIKVMRDFEHSFKRLSAEYGENFEYLNGLHLSHLNFSDFIDGFVDKVVSTASENLDSDDDMSIDNNANSATNRDIVALNKEKTKPHDKLFAFSKIFYELTKEYGLNTARKWLHAEWTGKFYLHDGPSSTYIPYCYAYDLTRLAKEGLFWIGNYNAQPPKHLTTFTDDLIEYISYFSNRSSGAVGIPNVLIWTFYFWKKDVEAGYYLMSPDYYIRQSFQKLIYRLNQPFMRIDQSAFVNVSIFDRNYIEALFGGVEYPDGKIGRAHV